VAQLGAVALWTNLYLDSSNLLNKFMYTTSIIVYTTFLAPTAGGALAARVRRLYGGLPRPLLQVALVQVGMLTQGGQGGHPAL
jgi:hypothetical protein